MRSYRTARFMAWLFVSLGVVLQAVMASDIPSGLGGR
jgi:hypothetical protein